MTGFFQQPELTPKPVLEPSSFDVLRDLYASKLVNQQANPYGFDPSKGQSQESLFTGNGRGSFNPYNGSYGPNPAGYANPGSMAGPSMGGSGGGQGGMYGFGGGGQMGGGQKPGGDPSRSALIAYIMELMKGGGQGQQQAPLMPMGNDGYTLNNQITQSGGAFDGCQIGHDGAQPPQVDPANFGNPSAVQNWLNMNPGNHGAFGSTPTHMDPNNPFGGGGGSAPPPAGGAPPPGQPPASFAPRGAPAIPSRNTGIPQGYPTPFDRNTSTVSRTPTGPTPAAPPPPPGGNMIPGGHNPKFPIGMDSPYMFQRGPMAPLGMDGEFTPGGGASGGAGASGNSQRQLMEYIKANPEILKMILEQMQPQQKLLPRGPGSFAKTSGGMAPLGMDAFSPSNPAGPPGAGGNGFVGFAGGGSSPLTAPSAGGGIQAFIQALMAGGGGGGGMGGGMGMMKRRRPIGMDAGMQQPTMMNFRGRPDPRQAGQQAGHRRAGSHPMNPYARQGR